MKLTDHMYPAADSGWPEALSAITGGKTASRFYGKLSQHNMKMRSEISNAPTATQNTNYPFLKSNICPKTM